MKKAFYLGLLFLALFELANVWFIMPLPYSQRVRSIDIAYALHAYRWVFRGLFGAMVVAGLIPAFRVAGWRKLFAPLAIAIVALVTFATNNVMAADKIFIAPTSLDMQPAEKNKVDPARLVVGVEVEGQARAYPVQFIGYHHQVRDTVNGKPIMVSFCTVCRTGRVFKPTVNGRTEDFRLVGMDHFNAMFEDKSTGSWWRQANGEAIAGALKGRSLEEIESQQVTLARWLSMHPASLIMQPDAALAAKYSKSFDYETGKSRSTLTGTDSVSWNDKAWVVGITNNGESAAYDWNRLKRDRAINDVVGGTPVVIALAGDGASFVVYARPDTASRFVVRNDSLVGAAHVYDFTDGRRRGGSCSSRRHRNSGTAGAPSSRTRASREVEMGGGGAVVAVMAARERRIREIIDAFRLADATAVDRAKGLETIGLTHSGDFKELLVQGVLMPGEREGTYYLSEIGYISRRDDKRGVIAVVIVVAIVLLIAGLIIPRIVGRG